MCKSKELNILYLPHSFTRKGVIKIIVDQFGLMTADQLVAFTKNASAYKYYTGIYDAHLTIPRYALSKTGKDVFNSM